MKRLYYTTTAVVSSLILKASAVYAQGQNVGRRQGIYAGCTTDDPDKAALACVINYVITIVGTLVGAILVVMIVISGLMYITSMGNADKVGLAKKTLVGAIIGLIIVVLSGLMKGLVFEAFL